LQGRTALVTGAARRLGKAIAETLAREGADVLVHYGRSAGGRATAAELRGLGVRSWTVRGDSDPAQAEALWGPGQAQAVGIDPGQLASSFRRIRWRAFTAAGLEAP